MIKLSKRLEVLAKNIERGETMADIGTDHGFLPLYLAENGICEKVILSDVSGGSLDKARENAAQHCPGKVFDFRAGDGLSVLVSGEVDAVVIAGMGGLLMARILGEDPQKTMSFKRYILQPRNGQGVLRRWLRLTGFVVLSERLAPEGRFICEVITVEPPRGKWRAAGIDEARTEEVEWEVPLSLLDAPDEGIIPFLEQKIKIEEDILRELSQSGERQNTKAAVRRKRRDALLKMLARCNAVERKKT